MPIIWGSENESMRSGIIEVLERVSSRKNIKVLDAGGGLNSWLGDYVTHIIDINPPANQGKIKIIKGDINEASTWEQIRDNEFDFLSSTHTLEDIRDPKFVINQFARVARSGFIAVPNRRSEFQSVESLSYLGYAHHRWIFHLRADKLEAVAKWIGISNENVLRDFFKSKVQKREQRRIVKLDFSTLLPEKLKPTKSNFLELGLIWAEGIDFNYLNDDFAGASGQIMQSDALEFLSEPFTQFETAQNWKSDLYQVIINEHF
jgi:ubiquinone/menaquinone biosynthesis C-methylase UbiE